MRFSRVWQCVAILAALTLALPAMADTVTKYMTLRDPAKLSGKQLEPGTYRLDISNDGKLTVKKGKTVIAEAKGEWVEGKTKAVGDSFIIENGELKEIRVEGRTSVFMIR